MAQSSGGPHQALVTALCRPYRPDAPVDDDVSIAVKCQKGSH